MIKFLLFAVLMLPMGLAVFIVDRLAKRYDRFINPLTTSLARPPGAQLSRELSGEQINVGFSFIEVLLPSFFPVLIYLQLGPKIEGNEVPALGVFVFALLVWLVWTGRSLARLVKRFKTIRRLRLAYECELAVGQELDQLMRFGFRVFHDIQAGKFNIDHLVIGPPGVFAVETKGRSKRKEGGADGKKAYKVTYERGVLKFPGWEESEPPRQAERQARWAANWLSKATGSHLRVTPLVVLPGWYVESKDRPQVQVIASGYIERFFRGMRQPVLSRQQVEQIAYQVDQKVRDIPPGEIGRPLPEPG